MKNELERKLEHTRAAYIFSVNCLPHPNMLQSGPISLSGFKFENESQIKSMLIELGWSFFCRYEGCLEAFLKQWNVKLSKKMSILKWLNSKNISIPCEFQEGLKIYRDIRNKLHHDDGASLNGTQDHEIHLMPNHMEKFYRLFVWIGHEVISTATPLPNRKTLSAIVS